MYASTCSCGRSRGLAAAPALALTVLLGASLPVSAAVPLSDGRYATTSISCSQTYGQMIVSGTIKPASRYSSQSVAIRTFIQPTNGAAGFWNAWDSFRAPTDLRYTVNVRNANYTVNVQYGWYNGSTWSYAGEWIKSYGQFTLAR